MAYLHDVGETIEPVATSPLSSLHSSPTSMYDYSDIEDGTSDDDMYNPTSTDISEPTAGRLTAQQKLERVLHTLHEVNWTFSQFLLTWVGIGDDLQDRDRDILLDNREARTPGQRYRRLHQVVQKIRLRRKDAFENRPMDAILSRELNSLVGKTFFGKFDHLVHPDALDYRAVSKVMKKWAPTWYTLITQLLRNKRAS